MNYDECSEDIFSDLCAIHGCKLENCIYKSLSFSACGRYIIVKTLMFSAVSDISRFWSTDVAAKQLDQSRANHATHSEQTDTICLQKLNDHLGLVHSTLRPGELINQSSIAVNENGDIRHITLSSANQNVTADVSSGPLSRPERSLQLLTVPESFDTHDTAISVRLPETGQETVRLIFNKTTSQFFELSGRTGFPSVIERNIGSLFEVTPGISRSLFVDLFNSTHVLGGEDGSHEPRVPRRRPPYQ